MSLIKKELGRFLIAGLSAVGTDLAIYYSLLNFLNPEISKGISFFVGTIVAFAINKYWTFEKKEKSYSETWKFGVLYSVSLGVNIVVNKLVLDVTDLVLISFVFATGASTVLNFIGQKWWVFR